MKSKAQVIRENSSYKTLINAVINRIGLDGGRNTQSAITNVMAWFAAEEVCRMFDN